jgi:hypothetical protein
MGGLRAICSVDASIPRASFNGNFDLGRSLEKCKTMMRILLSYEAIKNETIDR